MLSVLCPFPSPLLSRHGIGPDFPLLVGCLALLGLGLVMVTSTSSEVAVAQLGNPLYPSVRHLIYLVIGLISYGLTMMIPMTTWQCQGWKLLLVIFGLLVLTITSGVGREVNGLMRWVDFGLFNIRPSEIAKACVVIFMAGYLIRRQQEVRESWVGFFKPFVVSLPMAGLLLREPDFGATVVMMGTAAAMLFFGGVGLFHFGLMVLLAVGAVVLLIQTQPYRIARLINFTDPWVDQPSAGYQLSQVLIASDCGGWLDMGLGNSIQKQSYLPEAHIGFASAMLTEELGTVGALATVALLVFVGLRVLYIGIWIEQAKQFFSTYAAYGLASPWIGQFLISIGVNIGLLSTKDLTLSFLSYGGSSLTICCAYLGVLLRIEWGRRTHLDSEEYEFNEEDFADER